MIGGIGYLPRFGLPFLFVNEKGAHQMASALTLQVSDLVKLFLDGLECFGLGLDATFGCQALD